MSRAERPIFFVERGFVALEPSASEAAAELVNVYLEAANQRLRCGSALLGGAGRGAGRLRASLGWDVKSCGAFLFFFFPPFLRGAFSKEFVLLGPIVRGLASESLLGAERLTARRCQQLHGVGRCLPSGFL